MTRTTAHPSRIAAAAAALTLLTHVPALAQAGAPVGEAVFDSSYFAWQRGDFVDALARLDRVLGGPDGHRWLEPAAVLTGELFRTTELTTDGVAPRWSPDGKYVAWEQGAASGRSTHIARVENGRVQKVAELNGHSAAFDGANRVYYIRIDDSAELTQARAAVDAAVQARNNQEAFRARTRVQQLEAAAARLVSRDIASGRESVIDLGGIFPQSIVIGPGNALHVLGAAADAGDTNQLYRVGSGAPQPVTTASGPKRDVAFLSGNRLLYMVDRQTFAIQDGAGRVTTHQGTQPVRSADGSTVAWVRQDGGENVITLLDASGATRDVVRKPVPVSAPALSADGSRLAFQAMPREDWELYVVPTSGGDEIRLTREIQHDLMPRFLDNDRVFAVMGEARHRRSFLYDLRTGTRTRLFHNNLVRTVAPEYDWVVSPDGSAVLIVAERDGDTVSPERGVYLMDLTQRVDLAEVRNRVRDQLAAERALRERGQRLYAGIEDQVRSAVADVSTDRIYQYEYDLYQFDSKHISQPGNAKAIEYLTAKLREFGYEPEIQWFEPRGIRTANVVAKLPGTVQPDVLYTVSSHFDSVERGPGADDDTSGTAALLEAARVLATRPQPSTIHFAFFTGEEAGLLGSREYVRRAVENGDKLVGALNNDMIGFANDQRLDNTIRYSNAGIRDVQHAAAQLFTNLITYDAKYYKSTDAHAYYEAYGDIVGGIGSYPILGNPHYHQTHDYLETINHQLVAEVSKTTIATLMQLTNVPSRVRNVRVDNAGGGVQVTWDALPEKDVAGYVVEWSMGGASQERRVEGTSVRLPAGAWDIRVSGVNRRGAVSWDAARPSS